MLKLIIGSKGAGKTKRLIALASEALETSHGSVVCLEQGNKLMYDISHKIRLIDTSDYLVCDGQSLFGFVAGIYASNHDITDIFIDSALKICKNNVASFELFLSECDKFATNAGVNIIMTSSLPVEEATDTMKKYLSE